MKTAIYARKSSESEDRQVQSIEDQLNALKSLADREHLRVDEIFVEACSAKEPNTRPEFQRLMQAVQRGEVSHILTWAMNRLSRNLVDGGLVAHLLQSGQLQSIRTIDRLYLPEDNALLLSIENGIATSFIQDLRKNVVRGMDGKAARGWYPGRVPIGYLNNPITREIDPDPERFPLVRKAWDLLLSGGYTPAEIYRIVVDLGLTSNARKRTRRALSKQVIYSLFSNPFYAGSFTYKGRVLPGKHRATVTQEEFDAAQRLLNRNIMRNKQKHSFVYAGIFYCGHCGCRIVADSKTKHFAGTGRTVTYIYYHCTNGKGICSKHGMAEKEITLRFQEAFARIAIPQAFADWAILESARHFERDAVPLAMSTTSLADQLTQVSRRLERSQEMRLDGEISAAEYASLKSSLQEKEQVLQTRMRLVESEEEMVTKLIRAKLELAAKANRFSRVQQYEQRSMILSLGERHYLTRGKLQISIHPLFRHLVTVGPLSDGYGSSKPLALTTSNPIWCTLLSRIQKVARRQVRRELADKASGFQTYLS